MYDERFTGYTITTEPVCEPVTVADLRTHLRLDTTDQDDMLAGIIAACRKFAEDYQHRTIITTSYQQYLENWPCVIEPVRPPLISVESVKYIDTAGTEQTLAADQYRVDTASAPGRITRAYSVTYPTLQGVSNQVEINFTAGYGKQDGELTAAHSGAVTSITADGFTTAPSATGVLYLVNAAGQYESVSYTAAHGDSGTYTFIVSATLAYSYAEDDVVQAHKVPYTTRLAILALAATMYEQAESEIIGVSVAPNKVATNLLNSEKLTEVR